MLGYSTPVLGLVLALQLPGTPAQFLVGLGASLVPPPPLSATLAMPLGAAGHAAGLN